MKRILITLAVLSIVFSAGTGKSRCYAARKGSPFSGALSGKVAQTMNAGGYTYVLLLEKDGKKTWVAVPQMKISVGQDVSFSPGAVMTDFESKTLKRTFHRIIFSAGPVAGQARGQGTIAANTGGGAVPITGKIKVKKALGPNGYTIAEIYRDRGRLNGKKVRVAGEVVKVLPQIMKRNWIHIQDGSGKELVVTSTDLPAKGSIVTVSGTVHKNEDFGMGYRYDVIIEDARIITK